MKSKYLFWFLVICILCATPAFGQQEVRPTGTQIPDNLSQDVILVPVDAPMLALKPVQMAASLGINASFNANVTNQQRAVIQQAINEWTAIIRSSGVTPGNYPITFSNGPLTGSLIGLTTTTFNKNSGDLISANMVIDNRPSTTWYVDPNPADDVEFNVTPPALPPAGNDLLTVVRHELGHALGWTSANHVIPLLSGNIFDPARFNIGTVGSGSHTDPSIHANDIMNPSLSASTRRPISLYPAATMLARAYSYDIAMSFVDNAYTGEERGSANNPWNTVREGADLAPFGQLLLTPKTYNEVVPLTLSRAMTINVSRGGSAVIGKRP